MRLDVEDDPLAPGHVELVDQLPGRVPRARAGMKALAARGRSRDSAFRQRDWRLARAGRVGAPPRDRGACRCRGADAPRPSRGDPGAPARSGLHHENVRVGRLEARAQHGLRFARRVVRGRRPLGTEQRDVEIAHALPTKRDDRRAPRRQLERHTRLASLREGALVDGAHLREAHRREGVVYRDEARLEGAARRPGRPACRSERERSAQYGARTEAVVRHRA